MMELERREREVRLGVGEEGSEGSAMERGDMGSVEKKQPRHFCKTDFSNSKEEQEGREWNGELNREKKEEKKKGGGVKFRPRHRGFGLSPCHFLVLTLI